MTYQLAYHFARDQRRHCLQSLEDEQQLVADRGVA